MRYAAILLLLAGCEIDRITVCANEQFYEVECSKDAPRQWQTYCSYLPYPERQMAMFDDGNGVSYYYSPVMREWCVEELRETIKTEQWLNGYGSMRR